jgi:hypothetical protein
MPGMRVASTDGAGWTVETVELALTTRRRRRGHAEPVGDGAQLCVRRHGRVVAYCASPDDLAALGVDLSRMAVVARWLARSQYGSVPRSPPGPESPPTRTSRGAAQPGRQFGQAVSLFAQGRGGRRPGLGPGTPCCAPQAQWPSTRSSLPRRSAQGVEHGGFPAG